MLSIAGKSFASRLFLGTGKFSSNQQMLDCIHASKTELVTVALKRVDLVERREGLLAALVSSGVSLLPNTAGVRTAGEAVLAANLAREALETNWIKLEIHPDSRYLLPDPIETLAAAKELIQQGFVVLPYIHADPVLCKRLEDVGVQAVMPLGAPIGSNQGLQTRSMLEIIIAQATVPVIIDAGIGKPSDAVLALEIGADAVLVNTAIASAADPVAMATAFQLAVEAGATARIAGPGDIQTTANPSSPLTAFLGHV